MTHDRSSAQPPSRSPFDELDSILCDRYLAGVATLAELQQIDRWVAADPARRAQLLGLRRGLASPYEYPSLATGTEMAHRVTSQIHRFPDRANLRDVSRTQRVNVPKWRLGWPRTPLAGIGAVAGLAIATLIGWTVLRDTHQTTTPTTKTYATRLGERATVVLPDGSSAMLAPGTTLTAAYTKENITVDVDGAALFTVHHDATTPFMVRTRQSMTRVLGTTFLVRQYGAERTARVAVAEGRVSVQATKQGALIGNRSVLSSSSLALISDSGQVTAISNVSMREYTGLTTGELVFRDAQVRDIVADLARAYDVKITIADSSMAKRKFDWNVQTNRYSLSQVLPELLLMLNAHAKGSSSDILILPGKATSSSLVPNRSLLPEVHYGR